MILFCPWSVCPSIWQSLLRHLNFSEHFLSLSLTEIILNMQLFCRNVQIKFHWCCSSSLARHCPFRIYFVLFTLSFLVIVSTGVMLLPGVKPCTSYAQPGCFTTQTMFPCTKAWSYKISVFQKYKRELFKEIC